MSLDMVRELTNASRVVAAKSDTNAFNGLMWAYWFPARRYFLTSLSRRYCLKIPDAEALHSDFMTDANGGFPDAVSQFRLTRESPPLDPSTAGGQPARRSFASWVGLKAGWYVADRLRAKNGTVAAALPVDLADAMARSHVSVRERPAEDMTNELDCTECVGLGAVEVAITLFYNRCNETPARFREWNLFRAKYVEGVGAGRLRPVFGFESKDALTHALAKVRKSFTDQLSVVYGAILRARAELQGDSGSLRVELKVLRHDLQSMWKISLDTADYLLPDGSFDPSALTPPVPDGPPPDHTANGEDRDLTGVAELVGECADEMDLLAESLDNRLDGARFGTQTLRELLSDESPDVNRLRDAKEYGKGLACDPAEAEVGYWIHTATIAVARWRLGASLSALTPGTLAQRMRTAADFDGGISELVPVFLRLAAELDTHARSESSA